MVKNSGVLLMDLQGQQLSEEEKQLLACPAIAGVILFARNYHDRDQLMALTDSIRTVRQDVLICVDQEGGRVQRFQAGFTRLPPARAYHQSKEPCRMAREAGWLMANELMACGVDLCIGPVLDIDHGRTEIVADRAFGHTPEQVTRLASAWIDGVHEAGMSVVIKHFPGHGNVDDDSHLTLPVDLRDLAEVECSDMQPFETMIASGVAALMPAHILYPAIDQHPVGFSPFWLKSVLRNRLGFSGLVVSDCLTMQGAAEAGDFPARARAALQAGCDLLIVSDRQGCLAILDQLDEALLSGVGPGALLSSQRPDWNLLTIDERYQAIRSTLHNL